MALASKASKSLMRFLTSPTKIAHSLDWKRGSNVLSLNIGKKAIDIAVASHPSSDCGGRDYYCNSGNDLPMIHPLPSIPVKLDCAVVNTGKDKMSKKKVLHPEVVEQLASIVKDWDVCGLVVNWPLEEEGWCGKRCGRVLHTLDQILEQSNTVINESRPVCLWSNDHSPFAFAEDEWGRSPIYSRTVNKNLYVASQETQQKDGRMVALDIWNDFCSVHWPELFHANQHDYDDHNDDDLYAFA